MKSRVSKIFPGLSGVLLTAFSALLPSAGLEATDGEIAVSSPTFTLSVTNLTDAAIPNLFFVSSRDARTGKPDGFEPLPVNTGKRGPQVEIPLLPPLSLYSEDPNSSLAGTIEGKRSVIEFPASVSENSRWLLVFHYDANGSLQSRFLDDSASVHSPGTVRLVNLTNVKVGVIAGDEPMVASPGKDDLARPETDEHGRFTLSCAYATGATEYEPLPRKTLRFRSDQERLLVVFTPVKMVRDDVEESKSGGQVRRSDTTIKNVPYRLYDTVEIQDP